jgi:hypothetical protein
VNDLPESVTHNEVITFADDTTMYNTITTNNQRETSKNHLEDDIKALLEWSEKWKVTFEPTKSHTMVISMKDDAEESAKNHRVHFADELLEAEKHLELVGLTFDSKLKYAKYISEVARDAGNRLCMLRRLKRILDKKGRVMMYKAFIRSRLEYATETWQGADESHLQKLCKIQKRAFKIIGANVEDQENYRLHPLKIRRRAKALETLYRLHQASCPSFLKQLLPKPLTLTTRVLRSTLHQHQHALDIKSFCNISVMRRSQGNKLHPTKKFERSFMAATVEEWNKLSPEVIKEINRDGPTIEEDRKAAKAFKRRVMKQMMDNISSE